MRLTTSTHTEMYRAKYTILQSKQIYSKYRQNYAIKSAPLLHNLDIHLDAKGIVQIRNRMEKTNNSFFRSIILMYELKYLFTYFEKHIQIEEFHKTYNTSQVARQKKQIL